MTAKPTDIKICGLRTGADVKAAVEAGARWIGLVYFEASPRHVSVEDGAALVAHARTLSPSVETVLLLVNPSAEEAARLAGEMGVDHIKLHGAETNEMLHDLRVLRPEGEIWKALPVSERADLKAVKDYPAADRFLFDAKPPKDASRPGGLGHAFDWTILSGFESPRPWLLAGGLTPENVAEAVKVTATRAVDVSSGVEAEKGMKDAGKIAAFASGLRV